MSQLGCAILSAIRGAVLDILHRGEVRDGHEMKRRSDIGRSSVRRPNVL